MSLLHYIDGKIDNIHQSWRETRRAYFLLHKYVQYKSDTFTRFKCWLWNIEHGCYAINNPGLLVQSGLLQQMCFQLLLESMNIVCKFDIIRYFIPYLSSS